MKNNISSKIYDIENGFYIRGETVEILLNVLAMKSYEAAEHCIRVSELSAQIGKAYDLSQKDMKDLYNASILHDIGKVFVDDEILNKPSKLTKSEYDMIKTHSKKGFEAIDNIKRVDNTAEIILYHHERYDGLGYPCGLKGKETPFLSRIIAVADAFDAMTSPRSYKATLSIREAVQELKNGKYTQFDGQIVDTFIEVISEK
ncbi:HD-GYP domain-containing protein [Wukongibacter baidiensis]